MISTWMQREENVNPLENTKKCITGNFTRKREGEKTFLRLGRKLESNINLILGNTFPVPRLD
jgi:hypothetical protein